MDLGQYFNRETLLPLALPVGVGLAIIIVTIVLRRYLYSRLHKLASKSKTTFDDIMIRETRVVSLLWCIWLGIYAGWKIAETPATWMDAENKIMSTLFAAIGVYTVIVLISATLRWYRSDICPRTSSGIDDVIMSILIFGIPVVGGILGLILILKFWDIQSTAVNDFLADHGPTLAGLTVLTVTLLLLITLLIPKTIYSAVRNSRAEQTEEELRKRADTLIGVIGTTAQILLIFIFILMVLSELTINITAILTGSAVLGLAIGFGAQSLVKDLIAGLFVIMENQYRKGDVVKIADTSGVVEEINLRRTILRDMDGVYHVVPNGEIRIASNYTKQMSKVNLDIGVSYDTDLDHAISVINNVGLAMSKDPNWASSIISPPKALRVENLGDSSVDIKVVGETRPSRQWDVTGELRLRLKKAFDKEGIEIPWPHTKVYFGNLPPGSSTKDLESAKVQNKPEKLKTEPK